MEKNNMLLWAGVILALLCILSMTTTEGFYRSGTNQKASVSRADTMPAIMTVEMPVSITTPTTQTISSANAAPTISSLSTVSPAPAIPSAPLRTKNTVSASRTRTTPGTASANNVNGRAQGSAPLSALTGGINNGARDVTAATTLDVAITPTIGNVQQQTAPGADAAAATIQNKQVPRKSVLTPSGLPSDLQSAINTYMPTNLTFRPPASILMGAPQMGVPQVGAAPINTPMATGTMGDIQMGTRPMRHRKPRGDSCPSDDCNNDNECENNCSDDCNE